MILLSTEKIEIGNSFIKEVDRKIFNAIVIFWLFKNYQWRLILGTPLVDSIGPQKLYNKMYDIYISNRDYQNWFDFFDIYLTSLEDPLTNSIFSFFNLEPFGKVVIQNSIINGIEVEEAIIIRSISSS